MTLETQIEVEIRVMVLNPVTNERSEISYALTDEDTMGKEWSMIVANLTGVLSARAIRGVDEIERIRMVSP